jgi:hypothetical protein
MEVGIHHLVEVIHSRRRWGVLELELREGGALDLRERGVLELQEVEIHEY